MTQAEEFRRDLEALERWLTPGVLDTRNMTVAELAPLSDAVAEVTTKMLGLRMGLAHIVSTMRNPN
jgi:hypothetical protein